MKKLSRYGFLVVAVSALFLVGSASAGNAATPCATSAQASLRSCQFGVLDDFWLSAAKCPNFPSREERDACIRQAQGDKKDALAECRDQNEARLQVCADLGGEAYHPIIDPADFVSGVDNPFFPLTPGTTLVYEAHTETGVEHDEVHVTRDVKRILGVSCTVVRDVVLLDGQLIEDTLDWYAQDIRGNVWYFGEEAKAYEDGELVSIDGSWKAGRDGALPGIIMEARPRVGDVYRQELLAGEAEDLASVSSLDKSVTVPYGSFSHCLMTDDSSPLEPDVAEQKFYAPGVGTVLEIDADGSLELIAITHD